MSSCPIVPRRSQGILHAPSAFAGDRGGATAVEFGLVAMPLLMTLSAIFEIGYGQFIAVALDTATYAGARAVLTGEVSQAGLTQQQFINQYICPSLPSMMSCSKVVVSLTIAEKPPAATTVSGNLNVVLPNPSTYYNYTNASLSGLTTPSGATAFCPGTAGQYIVLQVLYPTSLLTKVFLQGSAVTVVNGQSVYWQMVTATFENEQFTNPAAYAGC